MNSFLCNVVTVSQLSKNDENVAYRPDFESVATCSPSDADGADPDNDLRTIENTIAKLFGT